MAKALAEMTSANSAKNTFFMILLFMGFDWFDKTNVDRRGGDVKRSYTTGLLNIRQRPEVYDELR
ncbi:hypothetical protein GCM10028786_20270 [Flaviaesturariibacter terrae]